LTLDHVSRLKKAKGEIKMPTGLLKIDNTTGISSLTEQPSLTRRLARQGPGNLFGNATEFLVNQCGLSSGNFITVTSGPGTNSSVIFVVNAGLAQQPFGLAGLDAVEMKGRKAKKATKKGVQKVAKKAARKAVKKTSKKAAKKAAKKASKKG
jgi:hypothetical protein